MLTVTLTLLIFATLLGIPALASTGHEDEERKAAAKERGLKADEEAENLAKLMTDAVPLEVPNKCDIEIGPSWGEAE